MAHRDSLALGFSLGLGLALACLIWLAVIQSVRPRAEEIVGNDAPCVVQAGSIGKVCAVCRPGLPLVVTGRQTVARVAGHAAVFSKRSALAVSP